MTAAELASAPAVIQEHFTNLFAERRSAFEDELRTVRQELVYSKSAGTPFPVCHYYFCNNLCSRVYRGLPSGDCGP